MRIVSLLPSATEIVFALGLGDQLVGVSHECDYPPEARSKRVVTRATHDLSRLGSRAIHERVRHAIHGGGSLYALDEEAIAELRPDLILTQELCEVCAVGYREVQAAVRALDGPPAILSLEPTSIEGIFNTIIAVGSMAGVEPRALRLVRSLRARLAEIDRTVAERRAAGVAPPRVVALEWLDPPFAAGHWVPEQVRRAGGWEVLGQEGGRSVRTTWRGVRKVQPDMLVLMPCGYHLRDALAEWRRLRRPPFWEEILAVQRRQVFVVDGSAYFSRPGPRVLDGIAMLAEIFDPDAFVDIAPPQGWTPVDDWITDLPEPPPVASG